MDTQLTWAIATIGFLAFFQNISFSIVSRSRNRNNFTYHMIASIFSNGVWFITFRELVKTDMNFALFIPYTIGTVAGSLTGAKISMWIESWLCASSDEHIKPKVDKYDGLEQRVAVLEASLPKLEVKTDGSLFGSDQRHECCRNTQPAASEEKQTSAVSC